MAKNAIKAAKSIIPYTLADAGWTPAKKAEEVKQVLNFIEESGAPINLNLERLQSDALAFLGGGEIVKYRTILAPVMGGEKYEVRAHKYTADDALQYLKECGHLWKRPLKVIAGQNSNGRYCFIPATACEYAYAFHLSEKKDGWMYAENKEKMAEQIKRSEEYRKENERAIYDYVERQKTKNASMSAQLEQFLKSK